MKPLFTSLITALSITCIAPLAYAAHDQTDMPVPYGSITELSYTAAGETIRYGDDSSQFIEVWRAEQKPKGHLIFIHGGCWLSDYDIQHARPFMSALHQTGYNVYGIEYRRVGNGGGWPTSYQDISTAVQRISEQAKADELKTVVLGHSAGGHLALLTAADEQLADKIDAAVGLAAISNIVEYSQGTNSCEAVTERFMGGVAQNHTDAYRDANPAAQPFNSPIYLLHGSDDPIVNPHQSQALAERAQSVYVQSGAGHFDWLHPNTAAFARIEQLLKDIFNESN